MRPYSAGALALLLAGCGSLLSPSNPPLQVYVLKPQLEPLSDAAQVSWQLAVARPEMPQMLDTERIALTRGATMDYYADAQWTDPAARLLQGLLVEAFERSRKIPGVARDSDGVRADYILQTEVHNFEARYAGDTNGAPEVVVSISARLIDARSHEVIGNFEATHSAPASQNSVPAVVEAFDAGTKAELADIARWALSIPSANRPTGSSSR